MKLILNEDLTTQYNFNEDIDIIQDTLGLTIEQLARKFGLSENDFLQKITNNDKKLLDDLYDFCLNNNLYLNYVKWQEYKELNDENINHKILCHGSRYGLRGDIRIIQSDTLNDFGSGFYCGETLKQAGMFVSDSPNSSIYIVDFDVSNLNPIKFNVSNDWMFAVAYYRRTLRKYSESKIVKNIVNNIEMSDFVIAPIADNKVFELIDAFVSGELTDKQCRYAMSASYLGYQYVLRTQKAADQVQILNHCYLCPEERELYSQDREKESISSLNKAMLAKRRHKDQGKYIYELL